MATGGVGDPEQCLLMTELERLYKDGNTDAGYVMAHLDHIKAFTYDRNTKRLRSVTMRYSNDSEVKDYWNLHVIDFA